MDSKVDCVECFGDSMVNAKLLSASVLLNDTISEKERIEFQEVLKKTSKTLFDRIEKLGSIFTRKVRRLNERENTFVLSGLDELYIGNHNSLEPLKSSSLADIETLWGQVDLQNTALHSLLKNSVKKLAKASSRSEKNFKAAEEIRLIEKGSTSDEESEADKAEASAVDDNGSNSETEVNKMHERMNRISADMDSDDEDWMSEGKFDDDETNDDPAAEILNDGFFSIKEMEDFADEEEDFLPDEAYRPIHPEKKEKDNRSFHQKQRDGDLSSNSDPESGDEEESVVATTIDKVRRRKYRENDEVEALFQLYSEPTFDKTLDDELDVTQMTAADVFGDPNRKRLDGWKKRSDKKNVFINEKTTSVPFEEDSGKEFVDRNDEDISKDEDSEEDVPLKRGKMTEDKEKGKIQSNRLLHLEKIEKQTEILEKEILAEKPWQMLGETGSSSRPLNSLLESTPEFEFAAKMAPLITVEYTADLEEIIKKRILDEDWDDVLPRELPDVGRAKKKGEAPEVSQEKSKLGLGELYEKEYLKKVLNYDVDKAEKETEEEKAKNEMKSLFANLCSKLDALSNYHFTPRPVADEAEIRRVTQPAIAMEEVLPLYVSNARGVAPEEVYAAKRGRDGILRAESELEQLDRKRLRRSKKVARRKARKAKQADEQLISRLTPGLGLNNPYEKRKAQQDLSAARAGGKIISGKQDHTIDYNASGTFFKRMQAEAEQSVKDRLTQPNSSESNLGRISSKSSALKL